MSTFLELQDLILSSYWNGAIDDNEILVLYKEFITISHTKNMTGFNWRDEWCRIFRPILSDDLHAWYKILS